MSTDKKDKVWKDSLLSGDKSADLLVKIKRYGKGHNKFQVKYWHPDFVTPAKKKKRNK